MALILVLLASCFAVADDTNSSSSGATPFFHTHIRNVCLESLLRPVLLANAELVGEMIGTRVDGAQHEMVDNRELHFFALIDPNKIYAPKKFPGFLNMPPDLNFSVLERVGNVMFPKWNRAIFSDEAMPPEVLAREVGSWFQNLYREKGVAFLHFKDVQDPAVIKVLRDFEAYYRHYGIKRLQHVLVLVLSREESEAVSMKIRTKIEFISPYPAAVGATDDFEDQQRALYYQRGKMQRWNNRLFGDSL